MEPVKNIKDVPLQQRNQVRKRMALLDATIDLLEKKKLADISVEEICDKAEVSRGTFFRYFPRKADILFFYVRIWNLEATWHARKTAKGNSGLAVIEALFEYAAQCIHDKPRLFFEILTLRAIEPLEFVKLTHSPENQISQPERLLWFSGMEGIDSIPEGTFQKIMRDSLHDAVANDKIPKDVDIEEAVLTLASLFYGLPLMLAERINEVDLYGAYKKQLDIFWTGLRHTYR